MPKQPKAKVGRPPFAKGEAKAKYLRVRVTPDEHAEYSERAKKSKTTVSEWIRSKLNTAE